MSGKRNDLLDFKRQAHRTVYSCTYTDRNEHGWRLDVVGDEPTANSFVEARGLETWVEQISLEESRAHMRTAPKARKRRRPAKADTLPINQPSELPGLEVRLTLLTSVKPGAYRVIGELDPAFAEESSGQAPHRFRLELPAGESAASVEYHASRGSIIVQLSGPGGSDKDGPDTDGTASVSAQAVNQQRSTWEVAVFRASEGIAEYDLKWMVTTIISDSI